MLGMKRSPADDGPLHEAWIATDDLEDCALPPEEFVLCSSPIEGWGKLRETYPGDDETYRVSRGSFGRVGDVANVRPFFVVWKRPVLRDDRYDALKYRDTYRPAVREVQWKGLVAAAERHGSVLILDYADNIRGWAGYSTCPISIAYGEYPRDSRGSVTIVQPASAAEKARIAGIRAGVAKRAARRDAKAAAVAARVCLAGPLRTAFAMFREQLHRETKSALFASGAADAALVSLEPAIAQAAALYRLVVRKDPRRTPEYRAMIAAARKLKDSVEDLAAGIAPGLHKTETADLAWLAKELAGRPRAAKKPIEEAAPRRAGAR